MAYKNLTPNLIGFGIFLSKSPSLADPAGIYNWTFSTCIGTWNWRKQWHTSFGKAN